MVAATVVCAASVGAQTPTPAPTTQVPQPQPPQPAADASAAWAAARGRTPSADARFKVRVMEGVLERAVEHAATVMNLQLRAVSPDLVLLTGAARARGYRLDGYGLFFDVQVPAALRQSMGWTVRMMRQNNESVEQALTLFKRMVGGLQGRARDDAELALRNIELQVRPGLGGDGGPGANVPPLFSLTPSGSSAQSVPAASSTGASLTLSTASASHGSPAQGSAPQAPVSAESVQAASTDAASSATGAPSAAQTQPQTPAAPFGAAPLPSGASGSEAMPTRTAPTINPLVVQNPDLAYELEVREALIGAMVEWGATLPLQADEWFTVAARDNEDVVIPGEAAEVVTIIMRVRGSDLADFRAGRLTAADVRKRVELREF
jgi:hypothetical protein